VRLLTEVELGLFVGLASAPPEAKRAGSALETASLRRGQQRQPEHQQLPDPDTGPDIDDHRDNLFRQSSL